VPSFNTAVIAQAMMQAVGRHQCRDRGP